METISPETILAVSGFIAGVLAAIGTFIASRKTAKRDEVVLLREEVTRLQEDKRRLDEEIVEWRAKFSLLFNEVFCLRNENVWLKTVLNQSGIAVPPIPDFLKVGVTPITEK